MHIKNNYKATVAAAFLGYITQAIMLNFPPLLYIFLLSYILRLSAAVLGIVSNKRLVECTNKIGEGCMLLFRTVATALLLFLISITVVALSTNRGI